MGIHETLTTLAPFERLVLDAGFILTEALDGNDLLLMRKAAAHWVVRQEDHDTDSSSDGDEAEDEKHDLPGHETGALVVLKAEGRNGSNDGAAAGTKIPEANSYGLFMLLVPHTRDQHQGRGNSCLETSKENPNCDQRCEVLAGTGHGHTYAAVC